MINLKKLSLFPIIFILSQNAFAQDFDLDWKKFVAPNNWTINIKDDNDYHLNKKIVGRLIFKNALDDQLQIKYEIFNDFEIDSIFKVQVKRQQMLSSCLTNVTFTAFNYKGYYYLPFGCNSCLTNRIGANTVKVKNEDGTLMTNCEYLNSSILKFVASKP